MCKYCKNNRIVNEKIPTRFSSMDINICKNDDNIITLDIEGFDQSESVEINYCPMCGRKLGE